MLQLEVLIVVGNRAGSLNLAALTLSHLQSKSVEVAGFILCDIDQAGLPADSTAADLNEQSIERLIGPLYLGRMRHREPLAKSIVENLL